MAAHTVYTERYVREVWAISTPCTSADLSKALSSAHASARTDHGGAVFSEDYVMVESDDREIRLVITKKAKG